MTTTADQIKEWRDTAEPREFSGVPYAWMNELRDTVRAAADACEEMIAERDEAIKERDEAMAGPQNADWREMEDAIKLRSAERDEALAELERERKARGIAETALIEVSKAYKQAIDDNPRMSSVADRDGR